MNRYKDASPQQSVETMRAILESVDIHLEGRMLSSFDGLYSIQLNDPAICMTVNGKGTTEAYCMASAYGEALERLQSHYGYPSRLLSPESNAYLGFALAPDEQMLPVASIADRTPHVWESLRALYGSAVDDATLTCYWRDAVGSETPFVPYYSLRQRRTVLLPDYVISQTCGSNGLCAGNTPAEALCQGFAELCERYAKYTMFQRRQTPPPLPEDFVARKFPELAAIIRRIEESHEGWRLIVRDASLGMGLPVIGIALIDTENQRYHAKFGSHPSMEIALERCLTELFQGYDPAEDVVACRRALTEWSVRSERRVNTPANDGTIRRSDIGAVPNSYFAGYPSWTFETWDAPEALTNASAVHMLAERLLAIAPDVYIRDAGYLGFPAYRVYAPGVSDKGVMCNPHERARYAREKALGGEHSEALCQALSFLEAQDTASAAETLRQIGGRNFACAARELELRQSEPDVETRDQLLALFFGEGALRYVRACWRDGNPYQALVGLRETLSLFKTEKSPRCDAIDRLHRTLKQRMTAGLRDQAALGTIL